MERHANKNNVIETIKVPFQDLSKSGKTVFAYMRRSTTKKEQASSLPQQEEGIEYIAKELGIKSSVIHSFIESRSGFENRSRKEWNKMMEEIDKQKEACIILCRDTSRLSRNPTDNLAIANRIFGDNKHRKVIHSIFYLGTGMKIEEWNDRTNKKHIVDTLHQNYTDSMENKEKCIAGVLLKLEQGEFPYCPPHGLSRVNRFGVKRTSRSEKTTLKQDHEMPFILHAFEMKAEGKTTKDICKYLKQYGNINISPKSLVETLFANTVYKGVYTEKTTGRVFESIGFWDGKPPIDSNLWEDANARIGKRGHGFGEGQKDHIAPGILKHESGKSLYMYKAKGKYNAYQTEIKVENGKRKSIGIMESALVKIFLDKAVPKILVLFMKMDMLSFLTSRNAEGDKEILKKVQEINFLEEIQQEFPSYFEYWKLAMCSTEDEMEEYHKKADVLMRKVLEIHGRRHNEPNIEEYIEEYFNDLYAFRKKYATTQEKQKEFIKGLFMSQDKKIEIETKVLKKEELEKKKHELEDEKKNIDKKAFKLGYSADIANEMKQDTEIEILEVQSQIDLLSEGTSMEQYLDRLPEIVQNLHELASKVLSDGDYRESRRDIQQLMEIVSHELILTDKKELQIKLFEGLEKLETFEIGNGATDRTRTCDLLLRREAF